MCVCKVGITAIENLTGKGGEMDVYRECPFVVDTKCTLTSLGGVY